MPRKPKKESTYLTEQEVDAFFRVIRNARDKALLRLMYHYRLRASEPGKLMLSDYRPGPGKPRLRVVRLKGTVTGVEHRLLDLELLLKAWLRVRGMPPRPLFPLAQAWPYQPAHRVGADEALLHPGWHSTG